MGPDPQTVWDVLRAIEERAARRPTPYSTRTEVAHHLGCERPEVEPPFEDAIEKGFLEEHGEYKENWKLSEDGQTALDSTLFES